MPLQPEDSPETILVSAAPLTPPSFEEALRDLQQIVSELEGGTITLDQSLKRFEQGIGLLRQCYQFLDRTDQRIEQLVSLDANGNCTLVPFDAVATADKGGKAGAPKSESVKTPARKSPRNKDTAEPVVKDETPPGTGNDPESEGKLLF